MIQTLQLEKWSGGWGAALTLPCPDSISVDQSGNVTFVFQDPTTNVRASIASYLCVNVQQQRTRAGSYVCIADPSPAFMRATWQEVIELGADQQTVQRTGALMLPSYQVSRTREDFQLILYQCSSIYTRGSGVVIP